MEVTMRMTGWGALACATVLAVACDRADHNRAYNDNEPAATTAQDDRGAIGATDRAPGNATLTQGTAGQATADARHFAEQALGANMAEVRLGELAQKKAQNASVKEFAQMMIRDHTKAANELKQAVKGSGVDAPSKLDAKHQALYDRLSKLSGAEFDREYISAMVDGHREVRSMLDDRTKQPVPAATGTAGRPADDSKLDSAVTQWASKTLPGVNQHLQKAEQIQSQVK
jgi:putative membrane protein